MKNEKLLIFYNHLKNKLIYWLRLTDKFLRENSEKIRNTILILEKTNMAIVYIILITILLNFRTEKIIDSSSYLYQVSFQLFLIILFSILLLYSLSKKNSLNKLYRNIALILSLFVCFSIPLTYIVLNIGRKIAIQPNNQIGSADGWLSFIGSIIGGSLSMLALFFIIKHERNQNEILFSQQIMPILICENEYRAPSSTLTNLFDIKLNNVSDNILLNLNLKKIVILSYSDSKNMRLRNHIDKIEIYNNEFQLRSNIIKPNSTERLGPVLTKEPDTYLKDTKIKFVKVIFDFSYTDLYSKNSYSLEYFVDLVVQNSRHPVIYIDNNNKEIALRDYAITSQLNKHKYIIQ